MAEERKLGKAAIEEASRHLRMSPALVYRLISRYRRRPKTSSLMPWKRGPARNTRYLDLSREDLLTACIKEFYLVPERPSLASLFQEVWRRFVERRLPAPNYRTIVRRVRGLDPRHAMSKRQGSKAARDKYGSVGISPLRPAAPMDIVQIDHTRADV
jgi:putative transposase